jgi:hypothetical protein
VNDARPAHQIRIIACAVIGDTALNGNLRAGQPGFADGRRQLLHHSRLTTFSVSYFNFRCTCYNLDMNEDATMKSKHLRRRRRPAWPIVILTLLEANFAAALPAKSEVKQSFAQELISKPLGLEVPMTKPPLSELPADKKAILHIAAAGSADSISAPSILAKRGEEAFAKGLYLDAANLFDQAAKVMSPHVV